MKNITDSKPGEIASILSVLFNAIVIILMLVTIIITSKSSKDAISQSREDIENQIKENQKETERIINTYKSESERQINSFRDAAQNEIKEIKAVELRMKKNIITALSKEMEINHQSILSILSDKESYINGKIIVIQYFRVEAYSQSSFVIQEFSDDLLSQIFLVYEHLKVINTIIGINLDLDISALMSRNSRVKKNNNNIINYLEKDFETFSNVLNQIKLIEQKLSKSAL